MWDKVDKLLQIASFIVAAATLYFTIKIPKKMMWAQIYSGLNNEYRSHEFGEAIKGIVDFFHDECHSNLDKIKEQYENRYNEEFDLDSGRFRENKYSKSIEKTLHYQRRMVAQFYMQLDMCVSECYMVRRLIKTDYGKSETNLIKILYYMGRAASEYRHSYKDIKTKDPLIATKFDQTNLDRKLVHLYKFFKKEIGE